MAPRRNNSVIEGTNANLLPDTQGLTFDPLVMENHDPNVTTCCVPTSECLRSKEAIYLNCLNDAVKVVCSNEHCQVGKFMHKECFEHWEDTILTYLKSCGRARSWSDKQRHQNLWTKKGYDLAFRSCNCLCGRGFLKKDLDWNLLNSVGNGNGAASHSENEKKKKKRRQNNRPTIAMSAAFSNTNGYGTNGNRQMDNVLTPIELRARTVSISSSNCSNGSSSPTVSSNSMSPPTIPLPGVIGSGQKKKKKMKKPDP